MPIRLSVIIISKNSANLLSESLSSVKWADEIILLDNHSNDDTVRIARAAGAKVFTSDTCWKGYGIQRQRAQNYATGDYIFMMDADEKMTYKLQKSIQSVLISPKSGRVYSISRRNYFLGCYMRYSGWYPDRVIRLYERRRYRYNDNQVHESLDCDNAKVVPLKGDLLHFTCKDFFTFQYKQLNYAKLWANEHYKHGKKISFISIFIYSFIVFLKTLFLCRGFLDGKRGWLLAATNAQYTFNKYTELWALNQGVSKNGYHKNLSK